jgi:hypothetical protein
MCVRCLLLAATRQRTLKCDEDEEIDRMTGNGHETRDEIG